MAVTPIDGRYRARTRALEAYFSEYALIRYRVRVEVEWYLSLAADPAIDALKPIPPAIDSKLPVEMVHFACTSEDINNLAYALILKEFVADDLTPRIEAAIAPIIKLAHRYKSLPMMARTHGQEASPTTVGKEMAIFATRLTRQLSQLKCQEFLGKLNGAVGNFNAHHFAHPE